MVPSDFIDSSFLLALPTELRLQVYDYCLADTNTITITAASITLFGQKIRDRARHTPIPGLPLGLAPLVRYTYDPTLLSISSPATIELHHAAEANKISDKLPYPAPLALLQSCHQIHDELLDYMRGRRVGPDAGGLSLYVTYPYGILVLKSLYPNLLRQAKNVYISGYYISPPTSTPSEPRPAKSRNMDLGIPLFNGYFYVSPNNRLRIGSPPLPVSPPTSPSAANCKTHLPIYPLETAAVAPSALASLIRTVLPSTPTPLFQKLEARILYPGEMSYPSVWSDDNGPIVQMLRNACGGKIDMEVSRGRIGNAIMMTARPRPRSRVVSTMWTRLGSGRAEVEGSVVGEGWGFDDEV